jgi:murein DD-endopeptidase MepM/ murein hydrolase activator NlpD
MEQGTQLMQTINAAVDEATADPTITLVSCLLTEARTQIGHLSAGTFHLAGAVDGFASCITAFAAGGAPDTVIPGPDVGDQITQLPPGQTTTAKFVAPAAGTFTSGFGTRWGARHYGIGTPIVSVAPGTVISAGPASGFGLWVRVRHDDGTITVYGHNDSNAVTVGRRVRTNQVIAYIGNRGDSTGPHVHFEVTVPNGTRVDPAAWLRQRGVTV